MGLIRYWKDAGNGLFSQSPEVLRQYANVPASLPSDVAAFNVAAGRTIEKFITSQHHLAEGLAVKYHHATKTLVVSGIAPDHATLAKILLCCRTVVGVKRVDDLLTVVEPMSLESQYRAVKPGAPHSIVANAKYGSANACMSAFAANQPVSSNPEKDYLHMPLDKSAR